MENEENSAEQNSQNLSQIPQQPVAQPEKTSFLGSKWLKFGLVFVVLLLIGGSAYLLGKNNATLKTTPVAQTPAAQQTPTPLSTSPFQPAKLSYRVSSTATGNLFEEKNFGFSFQYSGLKICCSIAGPSVGGGINGVTFATNETPIVGSDASFDGFSVYVVPNSENLSFQNYLDQEQKALKKFAPPNLYAQRERVDIGILSGIAFRSLDGGGIENYYFPFSDNKNFLVFGELDKEIGSFEERFKEVLSTFKFTNQTINPTSDPTISWKTYTSNCGFSVKYPASWTADNLFFASDKDICVNIGDENFQIGTGDAISGFYLNIHQKKFDNTKFESLEAYVKDYEIKGIPFKYSQKSYGTYSGFEFDPPGVGDNRSLMFLKDGYVYEVNWRISTSGPYLNIIPKIISSIKFTK